MLAITPTTRKCLVGVVNRLTSDRCLREDLMQEAMVHFWKVERERPGQTFSWYLQSCSFHLRHYLASGRSIDSSKRRGMQIDLPEEEELSNSLESSPGELSVTAQVAVRECMHLLPRYLTPRERAILLFLADGFGPREIARHLLLSHPTVNKCRRKIAALAIRLGISPRSPDQSRGPRVPQDDYALAALRRQPPLDPGTPETPGICVREQRGPADLFPRQATEARGISKARVNKSQNGAPPNGRPLLDVKPSLSSTQQPAEIS